MNRELPTARWGVDAYVIGNGDVLSLVEDDSFELPLGNASSTGSVSSVKLFKKFSTLVGRSGLRIVELVESDVAGWTVTFANGISVVVGKTDVLNRLKRFINLYEEVLRGNEDHVVMADARYPSGVTIEWDGKISTLVASRGL